jgi:MFS family permease
MSATRNPEDRRWLALGVLCLSLLLVVLDNTILNVALPTLVDQLDASTSDLQWIVDSYVLVFAGLLLSAGSLGDRYGRHHLMAGGAVLWSLATSLTFWVTSYPALIVTRGLVGVGEASFGTLAPAYLADVIPLERRPRALGLFYLAIPLGAAVAYLVGGLIGKHFGWRPAFLLGGVPGLILALAIRRLPAPPALPRPAAADGSRAYPSPLAALRALWALPPLRPGALG